MTDKQYNEQKKRIKKLADKWIKPLGLGWWSINIEFERNNIEKDPDEKSSETIMCVSALPMYRKATIHCYLLSCMEMDDEELEKGFIHEIMHVFVSPMSTEAKSEQEEYVATDLANAFYWIEKHLIKKYAKK